MNPFAIFTAILDFVKGKQNSDAAKDLEQVKALSAEAVAFTQSTSPDYTRVAPWVNTFVAIMRPGLTLLLYVTHLIWPERISENVVNAALLSWFVSRGVEKVANIVVAQLGTKNGNGH